MKRHFVVQMTGFSMLASALLSVATPAGAQHMMGGMGMYAGDKACHHRTMRQGSKHMAQIKAKLHLTASQQTAWEAFSRTMNTSPEFSAGMHDPIAMAKLTTPERIEKINALQDQNIAAMQAHMKQRHEAVLGFYNQLSAEQQKTFDTQSGSFHQRRMN